MTPSWRQILRRDTHPSVQFIKYGICGVLATAVDAGTFYLLALTLIPAVQPDDRLIVLLAGTHEWLVQTWPALASADWLRGLLHIDVAAIEEGVRSRNFVIVRSINFVLSNLVAYTLNVLFVFQPGRHQRHVEMMLFLVVSAASFVLGTLLGWGLIRFAGVGTTEAYVMNILAAVLVNFACRKYFVFKG